MAGEIASAFVRIRPDTKGFKGETERGVKGAFGALGGVVSAGAKVAGAALVGLGGLTAITGFKFNQMRQQAQIAFTTMLGSGQKAKSFLDSLASFAAKTPFEFPELVKASQRLLAMGFDAKAIIPTMTAIGDAVAALGGSSETLGRVTTALGQIQAKGKASAEEMLQLTESGIPAWQFLADKIGTSVPEAMKQVSKGAIDAETTIAAVTEGMNRKFGGMMAKQSRTFGGLFSTVKDTFAQISGAVMAPFFDLATRALGAVADAAPRIQAGVERFMSAKGLRAKMNILWEGVDAAGRALGDKLRAAVAAVDWQAVWAGAAGISAGLTARLEGTDWSGVGASIVSGISAALEGTAELSKQIIAQLDAVMAGIEWETLGSKMGPGLAAALISAMATLLDPGFWLRHWEEMLAIALAVFPVGRLATLGTKMVIFLLRPFAGLGARLGTLIGDSVLGIAGWLGPRLGALFLEAFTLAQRGVNAGITLIGNLLGRLIGFIDDKLSGFKGYLARVLSLDAAIRVVSEGVRSIIGFFGRMFEEIQLVALRGVVKVAGAFDGIPGPAGAAFTRARQAAEQAIAQIELSRFKAKVDSEFREQIAKMPSLGQKTGQGYTTGFAQANIGPFIGGKLRSALTQASSNAILAASGGGQSVGTSLGQGIAAGVAAQTAAIVGATTYAVHQAIFAGQKAARAGSPSRESEEKIGIPIGQGIVRGFLLATAELPQKISDRLRTALEAGRATVERLVDRLGAAFSRLNGYVSSAFDEATRTQLTATEKMILDQENAFRDERLATAVAEARKRLDEAMAGTGFEPPEGESPDDLAARQQRQADAIKQADLALREALFAQQRVALDATAEEERKQFEASRALQKEHLDAQLTALQEKLAKHPEQWRKIQGQINALLAANGVDMQTSGELMGTAFATGMNQALNAIRKAATAIATLLKRLLKLRSPAEEGPLSDVDTWWSGLADSLLGGVDFAKIHGRFATEFAPSKFRDIGESLGRSMLEGFEGVAPAFAGASIPSLPGAGQAAPLLPALQGIRSVLVDLYDESKVQTEQAKNPVPVSVTTTSSGGVFRDPDEIAARALR